MTKPIHVLGVLANQPKSVSNYLTSPYLPAMLRQEKVDLSKNQFLNFAKMSQNPRVHENKSLCELETFSYLYFSV